MGAAIVKVWMAGMDTNKDGKLSQEEWNKTSEEKGGKNCVKWDWVKGNDGMVTEKEATDLLMKNTSVAARKAASLEMGKVTGNDKKAKSSAAWKGLCDTMKAGK